MIVFVEFNLNDKQKISVNVGKITNIFEAQKENETKICMGDDDTFSVQHKYADVVKMLTYFDDVKHVSV